MTAIDKLIQTADNEVGYLEKSSNSQLDDKTANAGMNNYTKYWRDIKNEYQGQPWCAVFVTWCFTKTFGVDKAHQILKHYPYVYCPTMSGLFKLYANPKRGDIVIAIRQPEVRLLQTVAVSAEKDIISAILREQNSADRIMKRQKARKKL